jgi:hypothetical protein
MIGMWADALRDENPVYICVYYAPRTCGSPFACGAAPDLLYQAGNVKVWMDMGGA